MQLEVNEHYSEWLPARCKPPTPCHAPKPSVYAYNAYNTRNKSPRSITTFSNAYLPTLPRFFALAYAGSLSIHVERGPQGPCLTSLRGARRANHSRRTPTRTAPHTYRSSQLFLYLQRTRLTACINQQHAFDSSGAYRDTVIKGGAAIRPRTPSYAW